MSVVVQKYGGTSLGTVEQVQSVARTVAMVHRSGQPVVVVVSARGHTTDELLAVAAELGPRQRTEEAAREIDQLLVTGECASAAMLALALQRIGIPAVALSGGQAGVGATGTFGSGVITTIEPDRIEHLFAEGRVVVVAGFHGLTVGGDAMTLGRGGSDTTAVALAVVLGAGRCEIFTDVDGVYTADPRICARAQLIPRVDIDLMAEMAFAGARVLHSRAVELAAMHDIELHVRNSDAPGPETIVTRRNAAVALETDGAVTAITHDTDVARVLVWARHSRTDLAADVLHALAQCSAPVDMVARSGPYEEEFRMGFAVRSTDLAFVSRAIESTISQYGGIVRVDEDVAKIAIVGTGLLNRPEHAARMIHALAEHGIGTSWVSTSQMRSSVIVAKHEAARAVNILHDVFELDRDTSSVRLIAAT